MPLNKSYQKLLTKLSTILKPVLHMKNSFKIIRLSAGIFFSLFFVFAISFAGGIKPDLIPYVSAGLFGLSFLLHSGMKHVKGGVAYGLIGYDAQGNPVYDNSRITNMPVNDTAPTYAVPNQLQSSSVPPLGCISSKSMGKAYRVPKVITLFATPGAGNSIGWQSADRILESKQANVTAVKFGVAELGVVSVASNDDMDIAATGAAATDQPAAVRRLLMYRAIEIYRFEFTSSVKLGVSNITINTLVGNIDGSDNEDIVLQVDNSGQQIELYQINYNWIWTANKAITSPGVNSLAAANVQLKLYPRQFLPYSDPRTF